MIASAAMTALEEYCDTRGWPGPHGERGRLENSLPHSHDVNVELVDMPDLNYSHRTNWPIQMLLTVSGAIWFTAQITQTANQSQKNRARRAALDDGRFMRRMSKITSAIGTNMGEPHQTSNLLFELMDIGLQQNDTPSLWWRRVQAHTLLANPVADPPTLALQASLVRAFMVLNRVYWFKLDRICQQRAPAEDPSLSQAASAHTFTAPETPASCG
jgi:hypothetical protein